LRAVCDCRCFRLDAWYPWQWQTTHLQVPPP
jgi:hypothetical protein